MADVISPVNLPPIASTGDAHDSDRGSNDSRKKNKGLSKAKPKDGSAAQNNDSASYPPKDREKKSPFSDVDFERTEHQIDGFA